MISGALENPSKMTTNTAITLSATAELPPLRHPWNKCITVGRGYELLRADLREQLLFLQKEQLML